MKGHCQANHVRILRGTWAAVALVLAAACAPAPSSIPFSGAATPAAMASPPSAAGPAEPSSPGTPAIAAAATQGEFALNLTPLPTATALPTLVLPTESLFAGSIGIWDGEPTYPADSRPGFDYRLNFDPATWAKTTDQYGSPARAHRTIAGCLIAPTGGRGLPLNGTVTHEMRRIGGIGYQINTAYVNDVRQFVTYVGGNGVIYTAFQVTFADQADQCISDAENVLGTLGAVSIDEATPVTAP